MRRAVAMILLCAVLHVVPPVVYLTLYVSARGTTYDLFGAALLWTVLLLGYDVLRLRRLRA